MLHLTARIVEMDRPFRFVDESARNPFQLLQHVHEFEAGDDGTEMIDTVEWKAPYGMIGALADQLLLESHMRWFVETRQQDLKRLAESGGAV